MTAEGNVKIHRWLYPVTYIYKVVVSVRNWLFDRGWFLRSRSYPAPILCVGNLAVGGTGKTPHTEYLIRLLQARGLHVATLSRGYKRKTKGYILADDQSTALQLGDEPMQMKQKFPHLRVAVDEQRCRGVEQLLALTGPPVDVILLDDAYQHRYISAGLNILLTDYHRLFCDDTLLPAGRLREPESGKQRAQVVIVTKCPPDIKPIELNLIGKRLGLLPCQRLYFTRLEYGPLTPLFAGEGGVRTTLTAQSHVLLVTGIASPTPMEEELRRHTPHVRLLAFADHHDFTAHDLACIHDAFRQLPAAEEEGGQRLIVTTEKDAVRLRLHPALEEELKPFIHVLPIEVAFLQNREQNFNQYITNYVRKDTRNRSLPPREDAHRS